MRSLVSQTYCLIRQKRHTPNVAPVPPLDVVALPYPHFFRMFPFRFRNRIALPDDFFQYLAAQRDVPGRNVARRGTVAGLAEDGEVSAGVGAVQPRASCLGAAPGDEGRPRTGAEDAEGCPVGDRRRCRLPRGTAIRSPFLSYVAATVVWCCGRSVCKQQDSPSFPRVCVRFLFLFILFK